MTHSLALKTLLRLIACHVYDPTDQVVIESSEAVEFKYRDPCLIDAAVKTCFYIDDELTITTTKSNIYFKVLIDSDPYELIVDYADNATCNNIEKEFREYFNTTTEQ